MQLKKTQPNMFCVFAANTVYFFACFVELVKVFSSSACVLSNSDFGHSPDLSDVNQLFKYNKSEM